MGPDTKEVRNGSWFPQRSLMTKIRRRMTHSLQHPRRAKITGMNHTSKADHLSIYTSSPKTDHPLPFATEMYSSPQVHKNPREAQHPHSSITSFTIHHSPFQCRQHIVGSFYDCSPVTTHSCLFLLQNQVVITSIVATT